MEASAIPATAGLARRRTAIGAPLLRIRSDEQLVSMFRSGSEEAFRAIHDRYRARLFAYTRQMLAGSAADAEDAVQEIFVRAYAGLRASDRHLALRAWLYRIAHNRCIDELRRPQMVPTEQIPAAAADSGPDPVAQTEQRDALRRLIVDVGRLPEQQRSALLMRELGGMTYADVSGALGVTVPAVKSLLVRARVGLAQASEARDTACAEIREDLILSHDRGVRTSGLARRHLRDCPGCRQFRREVRGVSRQLAGFVPALGPLGIIAKLLGIGGAGGGGAAAGSGAVAGGGATATGVATSGAATGAATGAVATGAAATGIVSSGAAAGSIAGAGHVVTLLAAAMVTAGGAIELQHISPPAHPPAHHHRVLAHHVSTPSVTPAATSPAASGGVPVSGPSEPATLASAAVTPGTSVPVTRLAPAAPTDPRARRHARHATHKLPLVQRIDPDGLYYVTVAPGASTTPGTTTPPTATGGTTTPPAPGTATVGAPGATSPGAAPAGSTPTTSTSGSSGTTSTTPTATGTSGPSVQSSGQPTSTGTGTAESSGPSAGSSSTAASVTPADTSGPFNGGSGESGGSGKHSRTVAVFTMTGN